jgi:hypothetical protein
MLKAKALQVLHCYQLNPRCLLHQARKSNDRA